MPAASSAAETVPGTGSGLPSAASVSGSSLLFIVALGTLIVLGYAGIFTKYALHYWTSSYIHGVYSMSPLVFLIFLWLLWRQREVINSIDRPAPTDAFFPATVGYLLLGLAVVMKLYGETRGYMVLRGFSLIPLLYGLAIVFFPRTSVKRLAFAFFFLVFAIPMPTFLLDSMIQPLLDANTLLAHKLLNWTGFVVARSGYVLSFADVHGVGPHEVTIAGGCSGINSLFACMAVGTLYLYFRQVTNQLKGIILAAIIAFTLIGNTFRIYLMVFLIYYWGPELGQGFFHEYSGIMVFGLALTASLILEDFLNRNRAYSLPK